jgi:hypothetical protein
VHNNPFPGEIGFAGSGPIGYQRETKPATGLDPVS